MPSNQREHRRDDPIPIARDGVQMMSIGTEFKISDDLSVSAEWCHTFCADCIPDIDTFIRTRRRQVSSRRVDIDFDQVARVVIHRTFTSSNSFAVLRVVNTNHSILTRRTD